VTAFDVSAKPGAAWRITYAAHAPNNERALAHESHSMQIDPHAHITQLLYSRGRKGELHPNIRSKFRMHADVHTEAISDLAASLSSRGYHNEKLTLIIEVKI
jgi:hypothetical protein